MAPSSVPNARAQGRSEAYQRYLDDCGSFGDILVGLCAGRGGFLQIQRQKTLKYFQSLSNPICAADGSPVNEETQVS